jgi:oligoribonuclease NrnB/cAMP/cGMP phosphodiesterase (DHH superfamily)
MLNSDDIDIVIYHNPCPDGFTSCTIAKMFFEKKGKNIEYIGLSHSNSNYVELYDKIKDKNVLICDFSFKREITNKILKFAKNILIIDHHLSALKELQDLDPIYKIFDMEHCGAYLVWKYFYPNTDVPLFVKYVEDNDIWLKAMPNTLEVTAYIASLEFEYEQYAEYILDENKIFTTAIPIGQILLKQSQKQIDNALTKSTVKMIEFQNNIYFVGVCNSTNNTNEVGNKMLLKYPYIDFSIIYSSFDTSNSISFRSDDTRANVSVISTKCGGGGHRNASGCLLYDKYLPGHEIGNYMTYKQMEDIEYVFGEKYSYGILNTTNNKIQFGKYMIQTRYDEENTDGRREIQELCELYRIKSNDKNFYKKFDFGVTWNYGNNKTWFIICYGEDIKDINKLFEKYDDYEMVESKKIIKFSLKGLNLNFLLNE